MRTWTERQAADFLHAVAEGRLTGHGSSLYGLHGGEVRGLCCSDIDLSARTITIQEACVKVTGSGVAEVDPTTGQASEPCRWMTLSPAPCVPSGFGRRGSIWRRERPIHRAVQRPGPRRLSYQGLSRCVKFLETHDPAEPA